MNDLDQEQIVRQEHQGQLIGKKTRELNAVEIFNSRINAEKSSKWWKTNRKWWRKATQVLHLFESTVWLQLLASVSVSANTCVARIFAAV